MRLIEVIVKAMFLIVTMCLNSSVQAENVDLELVLALDASGSVDMDEYSLQLQGIAAAVRSLDGNGIDAARRVVNVSGDGEETPPREYVVLLPQALAMARGYDIIINGLAISNEDSNLLDYYRSNVQSGSGSFAMEAPDYASFAATMRRKLLREIGPEASISSL